MIQIMVSGLILGISVVVRYAGIGFIAGYGFYLLLGLKMNRFKHVISNLLIFITASLLPVMGWFFYTHFHGRSTQDRKFDFEVIPLIKLQEMFLSFGTWIFGNINGFLFLGISVLFLVLLFKNKLILLLKKQIIYSGLKFLKLPLLLSAVYILFILFSASFLDHAIPLSTRIFSPVYPFFLCGFGIILNYINRKVSGKLAIIIPAMILVSYSFRTIPLFIDHYQEGSGFTSEKFTESPTIRYVQNNLSEKILYTNDVFLLRIFSENPKIVQLPVKGQVDSIAEIEQDLNKQNAAIIYLEKVDWRNYTVALSTLEKYFMDKKIREFSDGVIIESGH